MESGTGPPGSGQAEGPAGGWKLTLPPGAPLCGLESSPRGISSPVQQEQCSEGRKVARGRVGLLLKPDEDAHHQGGAHSIIHLEERRGEKALTSGPPFPSVTPGRGQCLWHMWSGFWFYLSKQFLVSKHVKLSLVLLSHHILPLQGTFSLCVLFIF